MVKKKAARSKPTKKTPATKTLTKKTPTKKTPAKKTPTKKTPTKKKTAKKKSAPKAASTKNSVQSKAERRSHFDTVTNGLDLARARVLPVSKEVAYARASLAMWQEIEVLKKRPGFLFADVGYKFIGGLRTDFVAVRIHVDKKYSDQGCIAKTCYNEHVPTDVIISNFRLATSLTDGGSKVISDGNPGEAGTLGMGVELTQIGKPFFLTCAHVVSKQQPPTDLENFVMNTRGEDIGLSGNRNPFLYRFDGNFDLALLFPHDSIGNSDLGRFEATLPLGVSKPNRFGSVSWTDLNRAVFKIGANVPHVSKGFIDSIDSTPIPIAGSPAAINHIVVRSTTTQGVSAPVGNGFANLGDSGAIVFTEDGTIIGMVRAIFDDNKDNEGDRAVVTRISNIASEFGVDILP